MMQELSKAGDRTLEKETLKEEQAAEQECPEKSKRAESRRWSKVKERLQGEKSRKSQRL